jgi:hypothetical protein
LTLNFFSPSKTEEEYCKKERVFKKGIHPLAEAILLQKAANLDVLRIKNGDLYLITG